MKKQTFCKNQDEFPDTHFFSYRKKKYPFKMDFFKISSKYFSSNLQLLETTQTIPLLDDTEESSIDLSDESIITFIKYVQHKKIQIDDDNVSSINYLSKKYEVSSLLSITNDYIAEHHQELALKILTVHQNNSKFDTSTYENILSEKLLYYIKNEQLLALKVPVLYRILEKYHKESKADDDRKEIFDFLFRCLQKYGREASPLFRFADFGSARSEYLNRLLTDYSEVFDFHFINSEMVKNFYEQQNEMIKIKEENRILQEKTQKKLDDEINAIRSEFAQKLWSSIDQMKKSIELKDEQIEAQKLLIMKVVSENNDIKDRLLEVENYVMKLKQEEDQKRKKEEELKRKQEEELKKQQHFYVKGHEFEGIFDHLSRECGGNPHLKGIINITSNGDEYNHCYDLIDKNYHDYFYPNENPNSYVQFDFNQYQVSINNYSLKSKGIYDSKLINWEVVGSNDTQKWVQLDERHISEWSGNYNVSTYSTHNEEFYRYVRIRLKGKNSYNSDYLLLSSIEFFGKLRKISQ